MSMSLYANKADYWEATALQLLAQKRQDEELLRQALEAIEERFIGFLRDAAITALQTRLEEAENE